MNLSPTSNFLPEGYSLHWYEIIRVIGHGGFGITYLASDKNLDIQVAIKEFLPSDFANRSDDSSVHPRSEGQKELYQWGLDRFISEARTLARFQHPNIVRVLSVFEQNNTAYMVMEYAEGEDLSHIYKREARFTEDRFLDTFIPILDGLALIHSDNFIHRDIKPANIYICDNHSPLLLDFGSARQSIENKTKALTSLVTYGYAPFEQYNEGSGKQGPWSDIYALGASLYVGIAGKKPVDALARGGSLLEKGIDIYQPISVLAKGDFSENFLLAIDHALMFKIEDRPKHVLQWAEMLLGKSAAPQLPDFMLKQPDLESEETVALPWGETGIDSTTAPSKGTQGLVDSRGKRQSGTNFATQRVDPNATVVSSPPVLDKKRSSTPIYIAAAVIALIAVSVTGWMFSGSGTSNEKITQQATEATQSPIDVLNKKGQQALLVNKLVSPKNNNAWHYFQQALKKQADNKTAKTGLLNVEAQLIQLANSNYDTGNISQAKNYLRQLKSIKPNSREAADLLSKIKSQLKQNSNLVLFNEYLTKAENSLNNEQLIQPSKNNAVYFYLQAAQIDAEDDDVVDGIEILESKLISKTENYISSKNSQYADVFLSALIKLSPQSAAIPRLQKRLKRLTKTGNKTQKLLSQAKKLLNKKRYTKPKNNNAYSVFRKVLKIQPSNKTALNGIKTIRNYYKNSFNQNLSNLRHQAAANALSNFKKVSSDKSLIRKMQRQLKSITPAARPEIEIMGQLIEQFKNAIERSDATELHRISQYRNGRKSFVKNYTKQYISATANISGFKHISQQHKAIAKVSLSNLTNKNNQQVQPGGWGTFEIAIQKNTSGYYRVHW